MLGYDRASLLKKWTPRDDELLAVHYTDLLRQSQFEQIEDRLDPSIKNAETRDTLTAMWYVIPSGEPTSVRTVDASVLHSRDGSSLTTISLEYEFAPRLSSTTDTADLVPGSWVISQVSIRTRGGVKTITGFHVTPTSKSFEEMNEFTFRDKGLSQYVGLLLALSVVALTLYAFGLCAITKIGPQKWVWLIAIMVGVTQLSVNWTTGEWSFTPLAFFIPLSVNLRCSAYGPWMLQIYSPVGALAFLQLRKRLALNGVPLSVIPQEGAANASSAQS